MIPPRNPIPSASPYQQSKGLQLLSLNNLNEVWGPPASGKTTFLANRIAELHKLFLHACPSFTVITPSIRNSAYSAYMQSGVTSLMVESSSSISIANRLKFMDSLSILSEYAIVFDGFRLCSPLSVLRSDEITLQEAEEILRLSRRYPDIEFWVSWMGTPTFPHPLLSTDTVCTPVEHSPPLLCQCGRDKFPRDMPFHSEWCPKFRP